MSRLLILASKLGYQTRSFAEAAKALGVDVVFTSDRCHQLEDPWADGAIAVRLEDPECAAGPLVKCASANACPTPPFRCPPFFPSRLKSPSKKFCRGVCFPT